MTDIKSEFPREKYEPVISQPVDLDAMEKELVICFEDYAGPYEIKTCYGDVYKIVNALRDYARLLRMVCDEWGLTGFHRATYEFHAEKLEQISRKYQAGIGYDYDKAVERCQKRRAKGEKDSDVGGEAMEMAYLKSLRTAEASPETPEPGVEN